MLGSGPTVTLENVPGRIAAGWTTPAPERSRIGKDWMWRRKELILKAFATTHGNRSAAAKLLGLEAKYFLKLMKSLGIGD